MENNKNVNQNEAEKNSPQIQTAFCSMCGNPIPIGENLCDDCINKQMQSAPNQVPVEPKQKKKLNPNAKKCLIAISVLVLLGLIVFGGFKFFQYIETKQNEKVQDNVTSQIENMNFGEFSSTDSQGNVTVISITESTNTLAVVKLILDKETGVLGDSDDPNDSMELVLLSEYWNYYYDKEYSLITLLDSDFNKIGEMQVELDDNKKIKSFTYNDIKYEKTDKKTATMVKECEDFIIRAGNVSNNSDEYETKARNSTWKNFVNLVTLGDFLDDCFYDYTFSASADRHDENVVHMCFEGKTNYYILYTHSATFELDYNISEDEFTLSSWDSKDLMSRYFAYENSVKY